MEHDTHGELLQRVERHVEPEARRERPGGDEDVAAAQLLPLHAGERDGDALSGFGPLDRPVMHLGAAHAHALPAWLDPQLVALADRPRPERPGRDGADAPEREGAVDVEARRAA